jgi:hypothetical protein
MHARLVMETSNTIIECGIKHHNPNPQHVITLKFLTEPWLYSRETITYQIYSLLGFETSRNV